MNREEEIVDFWLNLNSFFPNRIRYEEYNYISRYIKEFFCTLSSIPIFIIGIYYHDFIITLVGLLYILEHITANLILYYLKNISLLSFIINFLFFKRNIVYIKPLLSGTIIFWLIFLYWLDSELNWIYKYRKSTRKTKDSYVSIRTDNNVFIHIVWILTLSYAFHEYSKLLIIFIYNDINK